MGASLSEPHTSVTALRCVCMYLCLDWPLNYKFQMSAFKCFTKVNIVKQLLQCRRPEDDWSWSTHMAACICFFFLNKLSQLRTMYDNQTSLQTTHRQYAQWLKLLHVRAMYKLRSRNSAHGLVCMVWFGLLSQCMQRAGCSQMVQMMHSCFW